MFKLHAKKSTLNMTKFASLKKIHTKIIIVKRKLELNDMGFLYYSAKACPDLSGFIQAHFSILYHTSFISPKREIDETISFRKLRKFLTNELAAFFVAFWHPIFKREKRYEVIGHKACCNGRHLQQQCCSNIVPNVASYKKTVISKMNKMFYFQVIVLWMFTTLCFSDYFSDFEGFLMLPT